MCFHHKTCVDLAPEPAKILSGNVQDLFHSGPLYAALRPVLAIARKISRSVIGLNLTFRTSPKALRISAPVSCGSKRLSTNRTKAAELSSCIQLSGAFSGRRGVPSRVTCTSRNRSTNSESSSENRSRPCSRYPTWLAKLSISAKSCDETKIVDSSARSSRP